MSKHTPKSTEALEGYLLYSSAGDDSAKQPSITRTPLWALVMALLTMAGCYPASRAALHRAASEGRTSDVVRLLADGADPNAMDASDPWTPLMVATRRGHLATMQVLLEHGADPNLRDRRNGWTALLHAVHKNQHDAAMLLVDKGADVNARLADGLAALTMAAGYGNTVLVRALLTRGATVGASDLAAAVGVSDIDRFTLGACQTETVRALEQAPQVRLEDFGERLSLQIARWAGCTEAVRLVEANQHKRPPEKDSEWQKRLPSSKLTKD